MIKRFSLALCATLAIVAPWQGAQAATGDVLFNGTLSGACTIVVTQNGTLGIRSDLRVLATGQPGGSVGRATVTTNSAAFTLSVDQPTAFQSEPVANTTPTTFVSQYRATGATNIAATDQPSALNQGSHNVRVRFRARKAPGDVFPAGSYTGVSVLRCE